MDSFFDMITRLLNSGKDSTTDDPGVNVDRQMDKKPEQGTMSGLLMHPDDLMKRIMGGQANKDPANVTDEAGNIVDYRPGGKDMMPPLGEPGKNPFEGLLNGKGNGQGTISGFLARMLSPQRERDVTDPSFSSQPTVGGGDPNAGTPGTGVDPALNPVRTKNQRVPGLAPKLEFQGPPPPPDYGMPNALDPNQIEELRKSLLTQAGQMDPNNPNGLAGRMASPNAGPDMGRQGQEAVNIADSIRGFDGVRAQKMKAQTNRFSDVGSEDNAPRQLRSYEDVVNEKNLGPNIDDRRNQTAQQRDHAMVDDQKLSRPTNSMADDIFSKLSKEAGTGALDDAEREQIVAAVLRGLKR